MKIHKPYKCELYWLTIIYKIHLIRTVGIDSFERFNIMQEYFSYSRYNDEEFWNQPCLNSFPVNNMYSCSYVKTISSWKFSNFNSVCLVDGGGEGGEREREGHGCTSKKEFLGCCWNSFIYREQLMSGLVC